MSGSIWDKFGQSEKLSNYVSNEIEIGYSIYGPTLAIAGSMSTTNRVIFIFNMAVQLKHVPSGQSYQFGWFSFRPHTFADTGFSGMDLKMASKFMITSSHPHKYNILFSDQDTYSEMSPALKAIKREWNTLLENQSNTNQQAIYEEFAKQQHIVSAVKDIEEMSYWQPGKYEIKIVTITKKAKKFFEVKKSFQLTDNNVETLKSNASLIVADLCKRSNISYNFVKAALW